MARPQLSRQTRDLPVNSHYGEAILRQQIPNSLLGLGFAVSLRPYQQLRFRNRRDDDRRLAALYATE